MKPNQSTSKSLPTKIFRVSDLYYGVTKDKTGVEVKKVKGGKYAIQDLVIPQQITIGEI